MQTLKVDIAIIGAGTAGITAFHAARAAGKNVVLIDRGPLGTTCARVGCMPSKAALHAGMRWSTAKGLPEGSALLQPHGPQALWLHARQTRDALASGAAQRTRNAAGDQLIMAEARFIAPGVLQAGPYVVEADAVIVATGSRPIIPRFLEGVSDRILTTDSLFEQDVLPKRMGILGLGAIGLELGLALSRLDVQVIAADQRETIGGILDPEVQAAARQRFSQELPMWLGGSVEIDDAGEQIRMRQGDHSACVDRLLVVTGRTPNTEALHLGAAGIALDEHGRPHVDPQTMRAADVPVYFAGDVQPDRPLMHEAADEGQMAAHAALAGLHGQAWSVPARRVPIAILFTDPDVCSAFRMRLHSSAAPSSAWRKAGATGAPKYWTPKTTYCASTSPRTAAPCSGPACCSRRANTWRTCWLGQSRRSRVSMIYWQCRSTTPPSRRCCKAH